MSVLRGVPALSAAADPVWMVPVSSWLGMAAAAAAMLALLWLCGIGWAGLALRGAPPLVSGMLAPAFGAVALTTVTLFLERIGSPPAGWAAWAAILLAALSSLAAAVVLRRRVGEAGPEVPDLAPPPAREVVP